MRSSQRKDQKEDQSNSFQQKERLESFQNQTIDQWVKNRNNQPTITTISSSSSQCWVCRGTKAPMSQCPSCTRSVCSNCMSTCISCSNSFCSFCIITKYFFFFFFF